MINVDDVWKENIKGHNSNWPQIIDHPLKILLEDLDLERQIHYLM